MVWTDSLLCFAAGAARILRIGANPGEGQIVAMPIRVANLQVDEIVRES